ncbi:MAG: hypothetical protein IJ137_04655 [Eubacterium sp.]|nr:hypothetical protein [Eubacterium sp.]
MKRKIVILMTVVLCLIGNVSCNGNTDSGTTDSKTVEEASVEEVSAEGTTAAADQDDDLTTYLWDAVTETMPAEVVKEVEDHGVWRTVEGSGEGSVSYLLANSDDYDQVTLRLDFSYENGQLVQYVSKDYGFVQTDVPEQSTDEKEALELVKTFADRFCGKQLKDEDIKADQLPPKWEGGDYACYKDPDGASYLVWLGRGMVINYEG